MFVDRLWKHVKEHYILLIIIFVLTVINIIFLIVLIVLFIVIVVIIYTKKDIILQLHEGFEKHKRNFIHTKDIMEIAQKEGLTDKVDENNIKDIYHKFINSEYKGKRSIFKDMIIEDVNGIIEIIQTKSELDIPGSLKKYVPKNYFHVYDFR